MFYASYSSKVWTESISANAMLIPLRTAICYPDEQANGSCKWQSAFGKSILMNFCLRGFDSYLIEQKISELCSQ